MASNLVCRPGDAQAVKGVAASELSGAQIKITSIAEGKKIPQDAFPPFSRNVLALILPEGDILAEPNAIARYLYGSKKSSISIESWLEWEEACLRPAVYSGDEKALKVTLQRLEDGLCGGNKRFLQGEMTLADIVVGSTLRSCILLGRELSSVARTYAEGVLEQPVMKSAIEKVSLGKTEDSVAIEAAYSDAEYFGDGHPKLPVAGKRNVMITSALPYVNNVPHLGNIIGCVLSADVYARYCRARGYNCIYICGTDEYGTATETKALEEGLSCEELCDKYNAIHRQVYDWFDIDFDKFGRTPTRYQTEIAQETFNQLYENGFLEEKTIEQLYSEPLQKFLADRYVTGTCPKCGYEDARGDQCDACGSLLNPTELKNPKCALSGTTPIVKSTTHIFLNLPEIARDLQEYIDRASSKGGWSSNCIQVTNAWMQQGLKPRCITRDLKWGTPVPLEKFRDKVFYVWFDAPIGYVSITASYCGDAWSAWWKPSEYFADAEEIPEVELVQFMGKDNVPFHTIIFPASQIGSRKPWTMMESISVTEYLNYEDGKFSKSRGIGVFGTDAKETGIPVEVWRYYLLAIRPESQDSAFQWDDFAIKNNAELNDNLGNFINRTLKFISARFDKTIPGTKEGKKSAGVSENLSNYGSRISEFVKQYYDAFENKKMKDALRSAMMISKTGNQFFQETEIWKVVKEDRAAAGAYISACFGTVWLLSGLLQPFMPSFSRKVLQQINLDSTPQFTDKLINEATDIGDLVPGGHRMSSTEPAPLFRKITDDEVKELRKRYAGNQKDRNEIQTESLSANEKSKEKKSDSKPVVEKGAKEKKPQEKPPKAQKKAADADKPVDISRIDLRVGEITKAWRHPEADSLYVEEVACGEETNRTVVSGLVKFIPEEDMQNRRVVLVCNLKPANMRGIKSHAMVLAATSPDGERVELVEPPAGAPIGSHVTVKGYQGEPDEQLNPKKKVWEAVQPYLSTDDNCVACWKGMPLSTPEGACTVKSISKGSIK